jgi:hypothetical protein
MSDHSDRKILSLPRPPQMSLQARHEKIFQEARRNKKHFIRSLYQVVNVSPELTPDTPLPYPWKMAESDCAHYFLSPVTNQPVVWNGVVWSYRADGSHHTMQHFVEGVDAFGGRPPRIFNGVCNMYAYDGSIIVCRYALGVCISVTTRRGGDLLRPEAEGLGTDWDWDLSLGQDPD